MKNEAVIVKFILLILMGMYCQAAAADSSENTIDADSDSIYNELVGQIKNGSGDVDFTELRMAYVNSTFYDPYGRDPETKALMRKAYDDGDYEDVVHYANELLEHNFLDIDGHVFCGMAHNKMGNKEVSDYHGFIAQGLFNSIAGSGDGKTPETAYKVISISEEYAILDMLGMKMTAQWLIEDNGHAYDKLEVEDYETGEKTIYYFNIDLPLTWLDRQFK